MTTTPSTNPDEDKKKSASAHGSSDNAAVAAADHRRASYAASDLRDSTAENQLLENIEDRRGHSRMPSGDDFKTAVKGERPLLGSNVTFQQMYNVYGGGGEGEASPSLGGDGSPVASAGRKIPKFSEVARKIMTKRLAAQAFQLKRTHKRENSRAHILLESIRETSDHAGVIDLDTSAQADPTAAADEGFFSGVAENPVDLGHSTFAVDNTDTDRLIAGAMRVEKLFEDDAASVGSDSVLSPSVSNENLPMSVDPLLGGESRQQHYGSTVQEMRRARRKSRRFWRKSSRFWIECCNPVRNFQRFAHLVRSAYFLWMSLPLFAVAWVLYYYFGNPKLDFMPGDATVSWWMDFIGRQLITLELARATEWLVIDCFALGSKFTVRLFGPFLTLLAIQGKGWPCKISAWGMWDLFLLHGDNTFQTHWLYWTGLKIYSQANSGSYVLSSDLYLRVLLCLLFAGVASSLKRTLVAVYFGRRTFAEFQPRLEKILKEVVLLSEIADLAEEFAIIQNDATFIRPEMKKSIGPVKWNDEDVFHRADTHEDDTSKDAESDGAEGRSRSHSFGAPELERRSSGSFRVKDLLDRWEEPINKLDKTADASIHDILKFRRALSYMDESHPFGEAFGPATTRNECIESSHSVYYRLLKLAPEEPVLSFDVLSVLAHDEEGNDNVPKQLALKRLFRPDRYNQLPLLAFLQSCDTLYKKLRYFRASVGNASVINHVLEQMIDNSFAFVLFLVILSLLNFNPWPLLVSMSTLLVSFSFAMGSSASKYIEGILLIAVRRPYDLGDRIVLTSAEGIVNPGVGESWFVEDLNLYHTTLRYAQTNEVATVSNGTISGSRIVNCNRSVNAVVVFDLLLHICLIEEGKSATFVSAIEQFIQEHPRIWECLVLFRYDKFDADNEQVFCRIAVRHRNSWQDAGRILRDKGELQKFIYQVGKSMGVNFDSPPARRLIYTGGTLKSGQVESYKRNLLTPKNIRNNIIREEPTSSFPTKEVADALFMANLKAEVA